MHFKSFRLLDNPKFLLQNNRRMNEHLFCLKFKSNTYFNNKKSFHYNFPGLTAIEAWMLACILFVFGALVEYAAILFRKQKVEKKEVSLKEIYFRHQGLISTGKFCSVSLIIISSSYLKRCRLEECKFCLTQQLLQ